MPEAAARVPAILKTARSVRRFSRFNSKKGWSNEGGIQNEAMGGPGGGGDVRAGVIGIGGPGPGRGGADGDPHGPRGGHQTLFRRRNGGGLFRGAGAEGSSAPARDCGLREGDIITHINREEVDSIEEVQSVLQEVGGKPMSIRAVRDDKTVQLTAQAVQCGSDGQYKLGAWIRDSMAGIGTLTFCEPATGRFGALGHGINDVDTAQLMPLQSGSIMYSEVTDVKKGEKGAPGELHGAFQVNRDLGELYANTASGVFGRLEDGTLTDGLEPVPVAERKEVKTGAATILSNIAGDQVEEYQVEIIRVYPANGADTRNLMLKVTDPRLLETTGGIVQGMSGSPILQNGKLVGAVTHVLVNDPTQGYGILAENMLLEAENGENQS